MSLPYPGTGKGRNEKKKFLGGEGQKRKEKKLTKKP